MSKPLKQTVFFVTRIGDAATDARMRSDDLMELLLVPVMMQFNEEWTVVRADKAAPYGRITDTIIHHLIHAAVIVVDATGRNPNVFYELGVAHAFHRPVILIVDHPDTIPFDTKSEAHIVLPGEGLLTGRAIATAYPQLLEALQQAIAPGAPPPGPVAAAQAQLTPPDISSDEASDLLRSAVRDLTDRVEALELTSESRLMPSVEELAEARREADILHSRRLQRNRLNEQRVRDAQFMEFVKLMIEQSDKTVDMVKDHRTRSC